MQAIKLEAIFTGFSSRVDGSLSFRGSTPELSVPEKVAMMSLQGVLTETLIYPKEERNVDVVEVTTGLEHKTPSQRMRAVLFLLWKEAKTDEPFETFYGKRMESLIEWLKSKLPDERQD